MTKDNYGREVDTLRISLTQECNLICPYCHREGEHKPDGTMSEQEIIKIVKASACLGISKIKITGGEPLTRDDITGIIDGISHIEGIEDISMTTNGTMLKSTAKDLKKAGLKRINIGCDSLSSSLLQKTAEKLKPHIIAAKDAGLCPIKLNMVVLRGINENDINSMIEFSKETGTTLQLIELIKTGKNAQFFKDHFHSLRQTEKMLAQSAVSVETREMHKRRIYHLNGAAIEIVRPGKTGFCANCRTLRITSSGKIKPCLMRDDNLKDILTPLRNGANPAELQSLILQGIKQKEPFRR